MALRSINPATGEQIAEYAEHSAAECGRIVEATHAAFGVWRAMSFDERGGCFRRLAGRLRAEKDECARLMALEMGKPVRDGASELEKCALVCEFFAEHTAAMLRDEPVPTEASRSYVSYQPLGVVLGLMPWNFPFWQVLRYAVPTLMAGNTTVLKHANNVTGAAFALERLFREAGFPEHVLRALVIGIPAIESVIEHPRVAGVSLTGSTQAGRSVGAIAGRALKKAVLELGGSDPFIVLEDADLDQAAELGAHSRLLTCGQTCISAKRFIVPEPIRAEFERRLCARMAARKVGDPLCADTDLGPLARHDLRDAVHRQVSGSVARGARVLLGGECPAGPGAYYPPTVLTDVGPGMPFYDEEVFGPAAAVIPVRDEDEAVRVANDSVFGLAATVCSRDTARAEALARDRLEVGCCFINAFVRSDPRLPFGGIKDSGLGRELGVHGLREFVNIKTVYVA